MENVDPFRDVSCADLVDGRLRSSQAPRDLCRAEPLVGEEQDPATFGHSALGRTTREIAPDDLEMLLDEKDRTRGRSRHPRLPPTGPAPLIVSIGRIQETLDAEFSTYFFNAALG